MHLHSSAKRMTAWVAIWAVLAMTFMPLLSQAFGADKGWQEICGAVGSRWIQVDDGTQSQPRSPSKAQLFDHCPYCALGAGALGMPPTVLSASPLLLRFAMPRAFFAAPRLLHPWRRAQTRGPPRLS